MASIVENDFGCGIKGGIFHRRIFPLKKRSIPALPIHQNPKQQQQQQQQQGSSDKAILLQAPNNSGKIPPILSRRLSSEVSRRPSLDASRRPCSDASRSSTSSSNNSTLTIHTREQSNGSNSLARASSDNNMPLPHLVKSNSHLADKNCSTHSTGNIMRSYNYRQISINKNDPEMSKNMGNEEYKKGKYEEALSLYTQAICIDPSKAVYHSNKAAALAALGRLIEAVDVCREAVRIEPYYQKAHHRLGTLYFRLGEAEKALCHYKYSSPNADSKYHTAQALQTHLSRCSAARKLRDWKTLLKETQRAISSGVDSAPHVFALQAEALLMLHRHQEAYATFQKSPNFEIDSCLVFFGAEKCCYWLMIQARLYMIMGRLEDSVSSAEHASQLDSSNKEVTDVLRTVHAVSVARLKGNELFKASKFSDACKAYSEGLEHDPNNSLLLCNRAACRFSLGQYEKAVEDCETTLIVRPSYTKARLRRANCNAKLERWGASIEDYEMLIRETPRDEEVGRALFEARVQLKKQNGEDTTNMIFGSNLMFVNTKQSIEI